MRRAICFFFVLLMYGTLNAAVPEEMSYQGQLLTAEGEPVDDAAYSVTFRLYKSTGEFALSVWNETQSITTSNGMFDVLLGEVTPLPPSIFAQELYLGIQVGSGTELTPRIPLSTAPYAQYAEYANGIHGDPYLNEAGDTLSGTIYFDDEGDGSECGQLSVLGGYANLYLKTGGDSKTSIYGQTYGSVYLYDESGDMTVTLDAHSSTGGELRLEDEDGYATIHLFGGTDGDLSAQLPDSAINSDEMYNEPGIASQYTMGGNTLTSSSMSSLDWVYITIPTAGYIRVEGYATIRQSGTPGNNMGYAQIDETDGGTATAPFYVAFGARKLEDSMSYFPVYCSKVFYKDEAGTYSFNLEAMASSLNCASCYFYAYNFNISATFYPTAYGTVLGSVSEYSGEDFDEMEAIQITDEDGNPTGEIDYQVDLRELELRAKEARIKTQEAFIEQLEAEEDLRRAQEEYND